MSLRVSPLDAAQRAIEHTRRSLFPFRFERWLLLGFVAFLDQCGRGGSGVPSNVPGGGGLGDGGEGAGPEIAKAAAWAGDHVGLLMGLAAAGLLFIVLVSALVLWINSRGIFMYLEAVAAAPRELGLRFSAHAENAQSLFAWRFALAMATLSAVLLLVGSGALTLWMHSRDRLPGLATALVVVGLVLLALLVVLAASLASVFLRDFVAPLQWREGLACGDAARRAAGLLAPHKGAVAVYLALKIAFAFILGVASLVAACFTCCCALLPVVAQVVLQPFFFFERAWSLGLLEQLGVPMFDTERGVPDGPVRP